MRPSLRTLVSGVVALACGGAAGIVADLYLFGLWLEVPFLYESIHTLESQQGFYLISSYAPVWLTGIVLGLGSGVVVRAWWLQLSPWIAVGYVGVPYIRLLMLDAPGTSVDSIIWCSFAIPLMVLAAFAGHRLMGRAKR